ncbi:FIST signal transduction protein [Jiulongibacter sediminis]|uniref:Histidine kinase n=1 Tax=Jiulongibacter sediminis TaxID=1605367 RepID=A0A0P7BYV3_9BACT|nr:FIST N-terminal domain-containing protein [Jiulongibacter sediminis]KPM47309.1 histidine kinase [Jiulongibacter sediminis]TBX22867.1 histidine kinase [Jiulongibacter sediminis]
MKSTQYKYSGGSWQTRGSKDMDGQEADLVLCFGGKEQIAQNKVYDSLREKFPKAEISICSTSGEILQSAVYDNSLVAAAIQFDSTEIRSVSTSIADHDSSFSAGQFLANELPSDGLQYIMVFSDGSQVNGSELVKGLSTAEVLVTGGLAGDGYDFESTLVGLNASPEEGKILVLGFYGDKLKVAHGSQGGWDNFGLERKITKAEANVLYEIDGENALDLYKKYLGDEAKELPGAALLYPLSVIIPGLDKPVVRTILSVNEEEKSMVFAGDVPEGSSVRLMRANFDRLRIAASNAAVLSAKDGLPDDSFALLVSCVGRKLVLGPRVEDEIEAVRQTLGTNVPVLGFYAYGEISPFNEGGDCQLHNQTMTITTFYELQ